MVGEKQVTQLELEIIMPTGHLRRSRISSMPADTLLTDLSSTPALRILMHQRFGNPKCKIGSISTATICRIGVDTFVEQEKILLRTGDSLEQGNHGHVGFQTSPINYGDMVYTTSVPSLSIIGTNNDPIRGGIDLHLGMNDTVSGW